MPAKLDIDSASAQRFIAQGQVFVNQLEGHFNNAPNGIAASLAREYAKEVENAIITQKFLGGWPEYNPAYKAWKISKVGHEMFWLLFGNIIHALGIWKSNLSGYEGGIPPGAVVRLAAADQETNLGRSLADIAYWLEFEGVGKHHKERPLFMPAFADFKTRAISVIQPLLVGTLKMFWRGATR